MVSDRKNEQRTWRVLAIDLGGSSGRGMVGTLKNGKLTLDEIHRFTNGPQIVGVDYFTDIKRIQNESSKAIRRAVARYADLDALGVNSWGTDFGLLDETGQLIENPRHYRDPRFVAAEKALYKQISFAEFYRITGIQSLQSNTINQLYAMQREHPEVLARAKTLLYIPDLVQYGLTGCAATEFTIASTSGLLDAHAHNYSTTLLNVLEISGSLLPSPVKAGTTLGFINDGLDLPRLRVLHTAEHDTASAVVAVPSSSEDFMFISCGTWSAIGVKQPFPLINDASRAANIANELCADGSVRPLKNITGLWVLQACLQDWAAETGATIELATLLEAAKTTTTHGTIIRLDDARFVQPGNMPQRICDYAAETGQAVPTSRAATTRIILDSLAITYAETAAQFESILGRTYARLHLVGGGSNNRLLCQLTADVTGKTVLAGPAEATSLGNMLVQLTALGAIREHEAREVSARSYEVQVYEPQQGDWQGRLATYRTL